LFKRVVTWTRETNLNTKSFLPPSGVDPILQHILL
jgi:hypothetical protein